jgi:6-phosphogluconolactonase
MKNIHVFNDPQALADHAAEVFIATAQAAIGARNRFSVALSGGNTPRLLYERLANPAFVSCVEWEAVHLFWGDERCVPPDHADSNYRMVFESLLSRAPIPVKNVHRIHGELFPKQAAKGCESDLRAFFGDTPGFDLVLLGLGEDGHTVSLFPGSPALEESTRWAVQVEHTTPPPPFVWRVTLTLPVLNDARQVIFLVSGAGKAQTLAQIVHGGTSLPAERIQPKTGELSWLVDRPAGILLGSKSK